MRTLILFTLLLAVAHPNPSVSETGGRKANVICDIFCEAAKRPPPPYQYRHLIDPAAPSPSAIKPQSGAATAGGTGGLSFSTTHRKVKKDDLMSSSDGGLAPTVPITRAKFGHTFDVHGQESTNFLTHRAKATGIPQGQFLDNQKAASFIQQNVGLARNGAVSIVAPLDLPTRIIYPDGRYGAARTIRIVPSQSGVKTSYPEP